MDQVASAIFTVSRNLEKTALSSSIASPDFHIGTLLNNAWDCSER